MLAPVLWRDPVLYVLDNFVGCCCCCCCRVLQSYGERRWWRMVGWWWWILVSDGDEGGRLQWDGQQCGSERSFCTVALYSPWVVCLSVRVAVPSVLEVDKCHYFGEASRASVWIIVAVLLLDVERKKIYKNMYIIHIYTHTHTMYFHNASSWEKFCMFVFVLSGEGRKEACVAGLKHVLVSFYYHCSPKVLWPPHEPVWGRKVNDRTLNPLSTPLSNSFHVTALLFH